MKIRKITALTAISAMLASGIALPANADTDCGSIEINSDGAAVLTFGADSITVSGGGAVTDDADNAGYIRPDNLKTNASGTAVLTLPSIDLNGKGYTKAELYAACQKDMAVSVKVGDTEVASFPNVNNGQWHSYTSYTAPLTSSTASGAVTLNITGAAKTYAGNYVYLKLYGDGASLATQSPSVTAAPATAAPTAAPAAGDDVPYKNESLSFEERAADLVSRMTLEEKVAQLGYTAPAIPRLGVSGYNYWKECLHGVARQGQATNFPAPLALSNTWNRELINRIAGITSTEARAKNNKTNLSYYTPTINMARDPRWGRNEETYGEDPYLTGQLGGEFVKGMQGDDDKYIKIIATIKHFAANNNETYRRGGSSIMSEFNFRNYYTKVFENVADIRMPGSVMSSYNATTLYRNGELLYNYLPSAANTYLLTDILRRTWGFDGYVTTDCGAGSDLISNGSYMNGILGTSSAPSAAYIAAALKAGMDLECNLSGGNESVNNGTEAVLEGYISEQQLETSIYHLFLQRFRTGEFDSAPAYRDITSSVIESDEHVAAAEEAAEESWVLLKNDGMLPLRSAKTVAVAGDLAGKLVLGDYTGSPKKTVTPIDGIREQLGSSGAEVSYLGEITDDEKLFNVKSLTLVMKDGTRKNVDLSDAKSVSGMTLSGGSLLDVTPKAAAYIPNVSFLNVASVEAQMSTGARIGGSLNIAYGQGGPTVAAVSSSATADTDTYAVCSGEFTGEDGGYNGTADMYISASAAVLDFSVENYKTQLDAADAIIAYAGTIPKQDGFGSADASESHDRASIDLPSHQAHVMEICNAYPEKTVVVLSTVGQINVEPFMDKCKAILWTSYNGQTQGTALGRILNGEANPSGRLTTTWYRNADVQKMELSNTASRNIGGITGRYTDYDIQADGNNPGHTYQYYSASPIYPFGYGLSYTSFEYSNITIDKADADANGSVTLTADITNTGTADGMETVQLYVSHPQSGDPNTPKKQLKGFDKVFIAAGDTKTVTFTLNIADMALYSEQAVRNVVPQGEYTAYIGKNADDTALSSSFNVSGVLDSSLKTVKAMPDGVSVRSYISDDGSTLKPITEIHANLSAVLNDEAFLGLENAEVSYISSDESVAAVDAYGTVTSGKTDGTALITASVTADGVTRTDTFPVVNVLTVANDDVPYVIEKAVNQNGADADVTISYRGSTEPSGAQLRAQVLDGETVKSENAVPVEGAGKYTIATGAADGETVRYIVTDSEGNALSDEFTLVYKAPLPSRIAAYYLESPDYDYTVLSGGENNTAYTETVNGLSGYGAWAVKGSKAEYTYVDVNENEYSYSFTQAWQAGLGKTTNRSFFFTPEGACRVTALFNGSDESRSMSIQQGTKKATQPGTGSIAAVTMETTDTSQPVYIYGGSSNKYLYAIIVEYYGTGETPEPTAEPTAEPTEEPTPEPTTEPDDKAVTIISADEDGIVVRANDDAVSEAVLIKASYDSDDRLADVETYNISFTEPEQTVSAAAFEGDRLMVWDAIESQRPISEVYIYEAESEADAVLQTAQWNDAPVILVRESGETKVYREIIGGQRIELQTQIFYSAPEGMSTYWEENSFRINAIAPYKDRLFAGCDEGYIIMFTECGKCYQLKKPVDYDIKTIEIVDGKMEINGGETIDMAELGGDSIEADEALALAGNGAVLVDVRTAEEFAQSSYEGSVNIPLAELEDGLAEYDDGTVLIFFCASGVRSQTAAEKAKALGFDNVYDLGSIDKLL